MRITNYTTYSLRTLMFAALHDDRLCKVQEVADAFGISKSHLVKCVHRLGQWGFYNALEGVMVDFASPCQPQRLLSGPVRRTEDTLYLVECFDKTTNSCPSD